MSQNALPAPVVELCQNVTVTGASLEEAELLPLSVLLALGLLLPLLQAASPSTPIARAAVTANVFRFFM